jgi:thiol-disulfide isomerase/thioredoxin
MKSIVRAGVILGMLSLFATACMGGGAKPMDPMDYKYFTPYSSAAFQAELGTQPTALYFQADWCPTCIKKEAEVEASAAQMPAGSTIFVADYDAESALKTKYNVNKQTTFVFFDAAGNENGTLTNPPLATIIEKLTLVKIDDTKEEVIETDPSINSGSVESDSSESDEEVETETQTEITPPATEDASSSSEEETVSVKTPFEFKEFSAAAFEADLGNKPVVLYAHADWCTTCNKFQKDIKASMTDFPEGAVMYKFDYDKETALKAAYGVTTQTSFIFFDANGENPEVLVAPALDTIAEKLTV